MFDAFKNDVRNTGSWKTLRPLIEKKMREKHVLTGAFMHKHKQITEPKEILNTFCYFFCTIGEELGRNISSTERLPEDFLQEREIRSIFLNPVTETEIFNIVNNLKNKEKQWTRWNQQHTTKTN